MPELSDLPVKTLRMIAEGCEFLPRFNLRSTSKLMKAVVDQSKFVFEDVSLGIRDPRSLEMSFDHKIRNGHVIGQKIIMDIENVASMEKTAEWMRSIFKNAEIGHVDIWLYGFEHRDLMKDFFQKVKENLKSPLKAREIECCYKIDPFWICDKSYVQRLTCWHDDPNFFQEHSETLKKMEFVYLAELMNITDQDVLSMKAAWINLTSENFSAEMVNQLVDKFIANGLINSHFYLHNPKGYCISDIKIPDGFIASTEEEGKHEKIDGDKEMNLSVKNNLVSFSIDPLT